MTEYIPKLLLGDELKKALEVCPAYDAKIRESSTQERIMSLNSIYDIFYPSPMACEIYYKMHFAYTNALSKKYNQTTSYGVSGGRDSFSILGISGIGKSSAIERAISIISNNTILNINNSKVIPFLVVQTPSDASIKGLLLEVLRLVDEHLGTRYYNDAVRSKSTVDMIIGLVSKVCANHLLVLVVDEVQHMLSKNGKGLANVLIQLINSSSITLCFVGVPESISFFESTPHLARRSVGLSYSVMENDFYFEEFCQLLFKYQYTQSYTTLTIDILNWLYMHSNGILATVIGLFHTAQEVAILDGEECLNIEIFNRVYQERFQMLHSHIGFCNEKVKASKRDCVEHPAKAIKSGLFACQGCLMSETISKAKALKNDIISALREHVVVEEISI